MLAKSDDTIRAARAAAYFVAPARRARVNWSTRVTASAILMVVAKKHLPEVAAVLGKTSLKYTSLADRVCEALLDAAVTHWNHYNSELPSRHLLRALRVARSCRSLVQYAHNVACGIAVRERASENLATVDGIISNREMARVRIPIKEWLDQAYALLNSRARPQARVGLVQKALSLSDPGSVVSLLAALRGQGTTCLGAGSALGDEMTQAASLVCDALMGHSVVAYNESPAWSAPERTAADLLLRLRDHFVLASDPRMHALDLDTAVFPVSQEVWQRLQSNTNEARRFVTRAEARRRAVKALAKSGESIPPSSVGPHVPTTPRTSRASRNHTPASARKGCLISGLLLAGLAIGITLLSGDGSGPNPATIQEQLTDPNGTPMSKRPARLGAAVPELRTMPDVDSVLEILAAERQLRDAAGKLDSGTAESASQSVRGNEPEMAPAQSPDANTARPVSSAGHPPRPPAEMTRPPTDLESFTRGSHEDDVLRGSKGPPRKSTDTPRSDTSIGTTAGAR